jgi:hypothetical protein
MPKNTTGGGGLHAVKFYESPESLCHRGRLLGEGLIEQQQLWNNLATTDDFDLLCLN